MSAPLGCVLAIRDRPAQVLERTLQTYAYQTLAPCDKVLLDYGSIPEVAAAYRPLCQQYGWRLVTHVPSAPRWSLSDAYNRAVRALNDHVDVVFKSDMDVMLGQDVLETAATAGQTKLCLFSCLSTQEGTVYPNRINGHADLVALLNGPNPPMEMPGEGVHAYPRQWFEEIGGYDLTFSGWGFEDSDLRERAKWSIGITPAPAVLLIHQGHARATRAADVAKNRAYYDRMKQLRHLARNGAAGPKAGKPAAPRQLRELEPAATVAVPTSPLRLAVVTRSLNEHLSRLSGELLGMDQLATRIPLHHERHRLTGADKVEYFRDLLRFQVDWVVNLDDDAFLLSPERLVGLIHYMDQHGYAAAGMPDGGVVAIRKHNPVACNAFFNVFDLRRVRPVWQQWDRVLKATHQPKYEARVPDFARRTTYAFDHFESYYGVFFSLLEAGERMLYLDAQEWEDGVSTLLKDPAGESLLIHCWYTRNWPTSYHTRRRYKAVIEHARKEQGLDPVHHAEPPRICPSMPATESNAGKWDTIYRGAKERKPFGDTLTYEKAARFLREVATIEDWGCGWAWFRQYLPRTVTYRGIDGSHSPFADVVVDLVDYTSHAEGILLRHVLENNPAWEDILANAVRSFTKRMVLVLFTPFADKTHVLRYDQALRLPDIAFAKDDLVRHFAGLRWELEEGLQTKTEYGIEHIFYLEKL
jgi:hypothetical protein